MTKPLIGEILVTMSEDEEYQVEAIRAWRWSLSLNQRMYFIKWKGYSEEDNTWEPESHLHCPDLLRKFKKSLDEEESALYTASPRNLSGFARKAVFMGISGIDGPLISDYDSAREKIVKNKFYCLLRFDDTEEPEEITFQEFARNQPEAALNFCEQHLVDRQVLKDRK